MISIITIKILSVPFSGLFECLATSHTILSLILTPYELSNITQTNKYMYIQLVVLSTVGAWIASSLACERFAKF